MWAFYFGLYQCVDTRCPLIIVYAWCPSPKNILKESISTLRDKKKQERHMTSKETFISFPQCTNVAKRNNDLFQRHALFRKIVHWHQNFHWNDARNFRSLSGSGGLKLSCIQPWSSSVGTSPSLGKVFKLRSDANCKKEWFGGQDGTCSYSNQIRWCMLKTCLRRVMRRSGKKTSSFWASTVWYNQIMGATPSLSSTPHWVCTRLEIRPDKGVRRAPVHR